jgi:hypothetical protein
MLVDDLGVDDLFVVRTGVTAGRTATRRRPTRGSGVGVAVDPG